MDNLKVTSVDNQETVHEGLGISKERSKELHKIARQSYEKTETKSAAIAAASENAQTPNELAYLAYLIGEHTTSKPEVHIMHGSGLGSLADILAGRRRQQPEEMLAHLLAGRRRQGGLGDLLNSLHELKDLLSEDEPEEHPFAEAMRTMGDGLGITIEVDPKTGEVKVESDDEEISAIIKKRVEAKVAEIKEKQKVPGETNIPA